jgi:NAD-dependent deacetylase
MKKKLVVFSGAGLSAESGLSTFRDQNGLWENHRVEDVASIEAWYDQRETVLRFYNLRRKQLLDVKPNQAHLDIAKLESDFNVVVVTQNVDDLHERAGSKNIIHLHGELLSARSSEKESIRFRWEKDILLTDKAPDGSAMRPDIVWFGEGVPNMEFALKTVEDADFFIVIGTSLQVYPAANLIYEVPSSCQCFVIDPHLNLNQIPKHFELIQKNATEGIKILMERLQ